MKKSKIKLQPKTVQTFKRNHQHITKSPSGDPTTTVTVTTGVTTHFTFLR